MQIRIKFKIEILAWKRKYLKGTRIGDGNKTLDKNTQVNLLNKYQQQK